ncbi:MAG: membrane protein insertase YidC [Treponema sp.]|jgi:YidC/Oxa1 family membrane protein insertase|nr:membrane protein insertase YidC [Treponema sp.]
MEKNTLLAVVLSVAVLVGFYLVQGIFFPPTPAQTAPGATAPVQTTPGASGVSEVPPLQENWPLVQEQLPPQMPPQTTEPVTPPVAPAASQAINPIGEQNEPRYKDYITIDTELFKVVLSNAGGDVVSLKLKEHSEKKKHNDSKDPVEMVLSGNNEANAFTLTFGGLSAQPVSSLFFVNRISEYSVEFYRDFFIPVRQGVTANGEQGRFRLTKRYDFKPNDYMFELTVSLDGGHSVPGFNFAQSPSGGGIAYMLTFGPQIGPQFEKLDNRYDYRQYITYTNGKRKMEKVNDSNPVIINSNPKWAAISGKYFACIAIPLLADYGINFSEKSEPGLSHASRLNIIRPALNMSRVQDTYRFYLGPKNQETLNTYNNGTNDFGLRDMNLTEVANTRGILSPLEKVLKWFLLLFYKMIPNYGVAIILLTLLVKIVFFPLTRKGSEATLRMQALAPKIKELQEKYKGNPQKLNVEMGEFYKKEGYNPLSGCLPMLLQFPIFIAMYNLFNNHFDLRDAEFISGWIPDLSQPEAIWNFPAGVRLPLLGWTALRLLPFIYVGSQLLYGKVTQTPDQRNNPQMKMMLYVMPIVFFFVLYDMPSGLLIYWIFSNILTMVQQVAINKYLAPKRAAAQAAAQAASQAENNKPPKKKRK